MDMSSERGHWRAAYALATDACTIWSLRRAVSEMEVLFC